MRKDHPCGVYHQTAFPTVQMWLLSQQNPTQSHQNYCCIIIIASLQCVEPIVGRWQHLLAPDIISFHNSIIIMAPGLIICFTPLLSYPVRRVGGLCRESSLVFHLSFSCNMQHFIHIQLIRCILGITACMKFFEVWEWGRLLPLPPSTCPMTLNCKHRE